MSSIKIEQIREEVAKENWQLISTEYKNLDTIMDFICPEGHNVSLPWKKLRNKLICPICSKNTYKNFTEEVLPKKKGVQRILALDQATRITGYSIYDGAQLIKYGTFQANGYNALDRDASVRNWMVSMINAWQIDAVGLEGIQFQDNLTGGARMGVTTFEALARLQGILLIACYDLKVPCDSVHTAVWRKHCGVKGKGRADRKKSMQLLAKQWYDISVSEDEADAIGIGKYVAEEMFKKLDEPVEMLDWN